MKKTEKRKLLNKSDFIIILILLALSLLIFLFYNAVYNGDKVKAEIVIDGKVVKEVSLERNMTFRIAEKPELEFEIKDNKIRFLHSDCPDKICVNTGFISKGGQTAVCLPNKTAIKITAENAENEIDSIS